MADEWDFTAAQVAIEVKKMLFEIFKGLSLSEIIWIVIEMAHPMTGIFPVCEGERFHRFGNID